MRKGKPAPIEAGFLVHSYSGGSSGVESGVLLIISHVWVACISLMILSLWESSRFARSASGALPVEQPANTTTESTSEMNAFRIRRLITGLVEI